MLSHGASYTMIWVDKAVGAEALRALFTGAVRRSQLVGGRAQIGSCLHLNLNPRSSRSLSTMPSKYPTPVPSSRHAAGGGGSAPLKTLRIGRIKAAIWENSSEDRAFYNVKFSRTYMDEEKKFHDADSFGRDDLLVLGKVADQAHTFICERMAGQRGEE